MIQSVYYTWAKLFTIMQLKFYHGNSMLIIVLCFFLCIFSIPAKSIASLRINNIDPNHGTHVGNTELTVTGEGFTSNTKLTIWGGGTYLKGSQATPGPANAIFCSGDYAYLACGSGTWEDSQGWGIQIFNIQDPADPNSLSFFPLEGGPNNIEAIARDIFVIGNDAYVAASEAGLIKFDVDLKTPIQVMDSLPIQGTALKLFVYGEYIYLAADDGGLQIIEYIDQLNLVGSCSMPPNGYVLDVVADDDYAYLATGYGGLKVVDISDPGSPKIITTSYTTENYIAGIFKFQNHLYLSAEENGVEIVDISNPLSPSLESSIITPGIVRNVQINGNYLYIADDYCGVEIFQYDSDSQKWTLVGFQATPGYAFDLKIFNNHIFVADYEGGMQILDAENPRNPSIINMIDLLENQEIVSNLYLKGDYAYVCSSTTGENQKWLKILDISDTNALTLEGITRDIGQSPVDLWVDGERLYLVDNIGLQVFSVYNKRNPQKILNFSDKETEEGKGIFLKGDKILVVDNFEPAINIFSQGSSYPSFEREILLNSPVASAEDIWAVDKYAIIAAGAAGIEIFDLESSNPFITNLSLSGDCKKITGSGSLAYLANMEKMLQIVSLESIQNPFLIGECEIAGVPESLSLAQDYLYLAEKDLGLEIVDISDPNTPVPIASLPTLTPCMDVIVNEEYAFVAMRNGLMIVDKLKPCAIQWDSTTTLSVTTPQGLPSGPYHVKVTDPNGDSYLFPNGFIVEDNRCPEDPNLPDMIIITEGEELTFSIETTDPDLDELTYSVEGLPKETLDGTDFSFKPSDSGSYPISFNISDGVCTITTDLMWIIVDQKNDPPILGPIGDPNDIAEGERLFFTFTAHDPDHDQLQAFVSPLPEGATLSGPAGDPNQYTWEFSWKPNYNQAGNYDPRFIVQEINSGNGETDYEYIHITVTNTNRAPEISSPISVLSEEGVITYFLIEVTDPDPEDIPNLDLSMVFLEGDPHGAVLKILPITNKKLSACFLWTPDYLQDGNYVVQFIAWDQQSNQEEVEVYINIQNAPEPEISYKVDLVKGLNIWACPSGRKNYTSFQFLEEVGEALVSSIHAYDWDFTLLYTSEWVFGNPSGDDFLMDKSRTYYIYSQQVGTFFWQLD